MPISIKQLEANDIFRVFDPIGEPVLDGRHLIARARAYDNGENTWVVICEPDGYQLRLTA